MLLKFLRKRKNMKRIIWVLAILIIPAFVIWGAGTSDKKKRKGPDYAGKIFDRKVTVVSPSMVPYIIPLLSR